MKIAELELHGNLVLAEPMPKEEQIGELFIVENDNPDMPTCKLYKILATGPGLLNRNTGELVRECVVKPGDVVVLGPMLRVSPIRLQDCREGAIFRDDEYLAKQIRQVQQIRQVH